MPDIFQTKKYVVDPEIYRRLCTCGQEHPSVEVKYYSGLDAFEVLADDCRQAVDQGSVLLLDDENTHVAAGEAIAGLFQANRIRHRVLTLTGRVVTAEDRVEQVHRAGLEHDLIVAVGAGTINDLGKYTAGMRKIPYWSVPTAPSMNGFTSAIAAVKLAGVKRTLPAPPPRFIYIHPEVIRKAPLDLRQAGFCDVLAKSVSDIDWQIESLLFSGSYCHLPSALVSRSESSYLDFPEKIRQAQGRAVMGLLDGLLISGLAMSLAGSSAPASGGEHLVSHFLDMRAELTDRTPELHGFQVAAGIVLSAACYQRLAALDFSNMKTDAATIFKADADRIDSVWGSMAPEVKKRFLLKRDQLLQLDVLLPQNQSLVRHLCQQVRPPEYYADLMRRTGFELTLDSLKVTRDEFRTAALTARTIRERITVLDIAAQAEVLEEAAGAAIQLMQ